MLLSIITSFIIAFGLLNLVRLTAYMVAADVYDIKLRRQRKILQSQRFRYPLFSVLIPAYNEESGIAGTIRSLLAASYPRKEIIVIDDGSTDDTSKVVRQLKKRFSRSNIRLIRQKNGGKGSALNRGIAQAKGELVMVLDADSQIDKDALKKAAHHFRNPMTKAVAANVRIRDDGSWLSLIQRLEYLLAYRMKRSLTALNIEYIIGGVGSIYRASVLKQVAGYRTNTITEDIDLSMKVINRGNKAYRVIYASDVRTSTVPVMTLSDLIRQRYRWKSGRAQAFVRYKRMFFSRNRKYSKLLSWFQLPYAILGEIYLVLEPLFLFTILLVALAYQDSSAMLTSFTILGVFFGINIVLNDTERVRGKLELVYLLPITLLLMPLLSYVELRSLVKTLRNWTAVSPNITTAGHWVPPTRAPKAQ